MWSISNTYTPFWSPTQQVSKCVNTFPTSPTYNTTCFKMCLHLPDLPDLQHNMLQNVYTPSRPPWLTTQYASKCVYTFPTSLTYNTICFKMCIHLPDLPTYNTICFKMCIHLPDLPDLQHNMLQNVSTPSRPPRLTTQYASKCVYTFPTSLTYNTTCFKMCSVGKTYTFSRPPNTCFKVCSLCTHEIAHIPYWH